MCTIPTAKRTNPISKISTHSSPMLRLIDAAERRELPSPICAYLIPIARAASLPPSLPPLDRRRPPLRSNQPPLPSTIVAQWIGISNERISNISKGSRNQNDPPLSSLLSRPLTSHLLRPLTDYGTAVRPNSRGERERRASGIRRPSN